MKNTKKKNGAAKGKGRAALSAQQTIPYLSMHPDGVCKLPGGLYTKTVEYEDIRRANRLMYAAAVFALILALIWQALISCVTACTTTPSAAS